MPAKANKGKRPAKKVAPNKKLKNKIKKEVKTVNKMERKMEKKEEPSFTSKLVSGVGSFLSNTAGKLFTSITGLGEYKIQQNTLLTNNGPPVFSGEAQTVISHREFIADVVGSTDFNIKRYPVNPGISTTFPWLSQLASSYQEYKLEGLIFEFVSTSATAVSSTNTALGTIIMTTDYDSTDPEFVDKKEMEAYQYTVSGVPSVNHIHPIECAPDQNVLTNQYVRSIHDDVSDLSKPINFYDRGQFYIATQGMQAPSTIGELWVSYKVKLMKPKLAASVGDTFIASWSNTAGSTSWWPTASSGPGSVIAQKTYGQSIGEFDYSNLAPGSSSFKFTSTGQYLVTFRYNSDNATYPSQAQVFPPYTQIGTNTNYSSGMPTPGDDTFQLTWTSGGTTSSWYASTTCLVNVDEPNSYFLQSSGRNSGGVTSCAIYIVRVANTITYDDSDDLSIDFTERKVLNVLERVLSSCSDNETLTLLLNKAQRYKRPIQNVVDLDQEEKTTKDTKGWFG